MQQQVFPLASSHEWVERRTTQEALLFAPGMHFDAEAAAARLGLAERARPVLPREENLSGSRHNGGLLGSQAPEVARRIKAVLPEAHVVIFVRNQQAICRAAYAQYVSGGGTWGAKRYFNSAAAVRGALTRPWKAPAFEFEHFEFDRLVAHYDALFGRDRVHVYPYEWLRQRDALVARMQADLGLELSAQPAQFLLRGVNLFTRQSVVNKSYLVDLPGGQLLRHAAKAVLSRVPLANRRPAELPHAVRDRIAAQYPASNRRLMELRDLPLGELGYPL